MLGARCYGADEVVVVIWRSGRSPGVRGDVTVSVDACFYGVGVLELVDLRE